MSPRFLRYALTVAIILLLGSRSVRAEGLATGDFSQSLGAVGQLGDGEVETLTIRTTTDFGPPTRMGAAADGIIFPGNPVAEREVVAVRVYWDVIIADGHDAADIRADVFLPIFPRSGSPLVILDGPALGWSGSGAFNHFEASDRYNGFFGPVFTRWGWQAAGLPTEAVDVLASSRIEIDYLVPEPASGLIVFLIGGAAASRRTGRLSNRG